MAAAKMDQEQPRLGRAGPGTPFASLTSVTRALLLSQGLYYVAAGVWPLVHIESFERVTGPKVDRWLVKTVGALIAVVGASLLVASQRDEPAAETVVLSAGAAAALALVDVLYPARQRISAIYLLDAVPEAAVLAAWAAVRRY